MASIFQTLKEFKDFKNVPVKSGVLHGALSGLRKKVLVPIPANNNPPQRWTIMKFLLQLAWSGKAAGAVITGAFLSLVTFFAEQPAQLLRTLLNDPDIEAHIIEITVDPSGSIKFTSRGLDLTDQESRYKAIADAGPDSQTSPNPFVDPRAADTQIRTTDDLQKAINSITMQIWILLTKAVTAPDTARDSETRRWIKYVQQKRVDNLFRLKSQWLDHARDEISRDISIRRLMVEVLMEINRSSGAKSRIVEMIADIGSYISETGMAGFFLTIKFGIETKYPPLALNEFQGDLTTVIGLMKLYKDQGERAPYLVILEDAVQNKFAPGQYPLLWSYAMGVGVALDRQMNNLNFNRPFLEPNCFRLGQDTVHKMEGNIDTALAADLGLTQEQIADLKNLVKDDPILSQQYTPKSRVSGFPSDPITGDDLNQEEPLKDDQPEKPKPRVARNLNNDMGTAVTNSADEFRAKVEKFQKEYRARQAAGIDPQGSGFFEGRRDVGPHSATDMDIMDSV